MNKFEIETALYNGHKVKWSNDSYDVIKDSKDQYLIQHESGHCIGLYGLDGKLNGVESDFYMD